MKTPQTTTLTISVLSYLGAPHYLSVKKYMRETDIIGYVALLKSTRCHFVYSTSVNADSIIITEPNAIASEIIIHNNRYFPSMGLAESDAVLTMARPGNSAFWSYYDEHQCVLLEFLFGSKSNVQIGELYCRGEKTIEGRLNEILYIARIKYPKDNPINRKQLRALAIALGVYIPEVCSQCKQVL